MKARKAIGTINVRYCDEDPDTPDEGSHVHFTAHEDSIVCSGGEKYVVFIDPDGNAKGKKLGDDGSTKIHMRPGGRFLESGHGQNAIASAAARQIQVEIEVEDGKDGLFLKAVTVPARGGKS